MSMTGNRERSPSVSRRKFLGHSAVAGMGSVVSAGAANARSLPRGSQRPNIVYIHSHDSGRHLEPYEGGVPTPAIARLAREGVLFHKAFSGAPICSPSRAAMLTGQPAHASGMLGLAHRGFSLNDPRQLLFRYLQNYGYQSILTGMQHVAADPNTLGYDRNLCQRSANGHWLSEASIVAPVAERFLDSRPKQPFFLDVGFFETHRDYPSPTAQDRAAVRSVPGPVPDTPETREDYAAFGASARQLDEGVGRVLEALRRNGYDRNTLLVFTTDHGIAFPRMKCNLTDDGTGVSLILKGPGIAPGQETDVMVSQIDLFPTLCAYLNIPAPSWLTGKSFLPVLSGSKTEIHEAVFSEVTYHAAYEPMRSIRTSRWKYIRRFGGRARPVLPNCDDSPSKTVWLDAGWKNQTLPEEALYDLMFDPTEHDNQILNPAHAEVVRDLRHRLDRWMRQTRDPLLKGAVAAPAGAVVNLVDGVSPGEPTVPVIGKGS